MDKIVFTESEIAFIIHVLSKYYITNKDVRKVIRLLLLHMPVENEQTRV